MANQQSHKSYTCSQASIRLLRLPFVHINIVLSQPIQLRTLHLARYATRILIHILLGLPNSHSIII